MKKFKVTFADNSVEYVDAESADEIKSDITPIVSIEECETGPSNAGGRV